MMWRKFVLKAKNNNNIENFDAFSKCREDWFLVSHATQRSRCCLVVENEKCEKWAAHWIGHWIFMNMITIRSSRWSEQLALTFQWISIASFFFSVSKMWESKRTMVEKIPRKCETWTRLKWRISIDGNTISPLTSSPTLCFVISRQATKHKNKLNSLKYSKYYECARVP